MKVLRPRTFGVGEIVRYEIGGALLRLIDCPNPVAVTFFRNGAPLDETAIDVTAGFWAKPRGGFDAFTVQSATAQTVTIGVSSGDSSVDRVYGSTSITNNVNNPIPVAINPDCEATDFANLWWSPATLNTPDMRIDPVANVNGAIVWNAQLLYKPTTGEGALVLMSKQSPAPTSWLAQHCLLFAYGNSADAAHAYQLLRPVKIPPTYGLWVIPNANGIYRATIAVELL